MFKIGEHLFRDKDNARAVLHRVFAAAAISTYYWYRLPGPASLLPDWFPLVSHMVTTPFFFWFLVLRSPKVGWLKRPVMASAYWSTRFEAANKNLIHAGPTESSRGLGKAGLGQGGTWAGRDLGTDALRTKRSIAATAAYPIEG